MPLPCSERGRTSTNLMPQIRCQWGKALIHTVNRVGINNKDMAMTMETNMINTNPEEQEMDNITTIMGTHLMVVKLKEAILEGLSAVMKAQIGLVKISVASINEVSYKIQELGEACRSVRVEVGAGW